MKEDFNDTMPEALNNRRSNTEETLTKLSVNFQYLQRDITEIKADIKEIKDDNISRREFDDYKKDTDKRISFITGVLYTLGSTVILAVIYAGLKYIIK